MLGPVSRFPLGLLDLFGVKQMGAYPGEIAQAYSPTLDLLAMTLRANSEQTLIDLPINIGVAGGTVVTGTYPVLYDGVNQLSTAENECMFITAWNIQWTAIGAGVLLPDATLVYDAASGGNRISFLDTLPFVGGFGGSAGETTSFQIGDAEALIYVPPGKVINLCTSRNAFVPLGEEGRIATCLRYLKMRV
jgi:hypothetical protein